MTDVTNTIKSEVEANTNAINAKAEARKESQLKAKADKAAQAVVDSKEKEIADLAKAEEKAQKKIERDKINAEKKEQKTKAEAVRKEEAKVRKAEKAEANKEVTKIKMEKAQAALTKRSVKIANLTSKLNGTPVSVEVDTASILEAAKQKENEINNELSEIRIKRNANIAATERAITKLNMSLAKKYAELDAWEAKRAQEATKRNEKVQNTIAKKSTRTSKVDPVKVQTNIDRLILAQEKAQATFEKLYSKTNVA